MATKITTEVWEHSKAKGSALLLLLALADFADSDHAQCWPAVQRLAFMIRMSERNTQYLLRKLAADGHIAIKLRGSPRKTNLYQVLRPWCKDCAVQTTEGATGRTGDGAKVFAPDPKSSEPKPEKRENARACGEGEKPQVTKVTEADLSRLLTPGSAPWYYAQGLTPPWEEGEAALNGNGHYKDSIASANGFPCRL
jgi:hypothetical protein